jgi:hypothetical protein
MCDGACRRLGALFETLLGPHPRVLRQSPQGSILLLEIRMIATMGFMSDLIENLPSVKARRREFNRLSLANIP